MIVEIKIPSVGESINEVSIARWLKEDGDYVFMDDPLCEIESDKATLELPAETAGAIKLIAEEGADLAIGDVIATIDTDAEAPELPTAPAEEKTEPAPVEAAAAPTPAPAPPAETSAAAGHPSPAAAKIMAENGLPAGSVNGTGKGGRVTKQDVIAALAGGASAGQIMAGQKQFSRDSQREKMSKLRRTIARRLVGVKNETAMLTTFNEADMGAILEIRKQHKEKFKEKHGVGLGFMSFFTRACAIALQEFPAVNGMIDGEEIVLHDYVDISIAVSTERGLVVPVIRNAESLSMAGIEQTVVELATKAREGKLGLDEMEGGTFTITNGGVFGSLMSTPIINAPQSAILGMHKIQERPMAVNGQVEVRPMMYLALSYDHRIIDGKESVSFLVKVKELLENPEQMLLGHDPVDLLLEL
jgi:2-oxoglutarate dehydrogenase E2 component (dihydrolipoamide succinyltransferase)